VQDLMLLHESQFLAVVEDDQDAHRFDIPIHYANEKKQNAKYAYMSHLDEHGCTNADEIDAGRTRTYDRQYVEVTVGAQESGCY
jgi:hypothetical protein